MEFIISGILAMIVIIIFALVFRKKMYDSVDHYEDWKLDIISRNVPSELARVKDLNLAGETKEKFEGWKRAWDDVLTVDLTSAEEVMFDTEKAIDRFRFPTAKRAMKKLEEILNQAEEEIKIILGELNTLIDTAETNQKEAELLKPKLGRLRKMLARDRFLYNRAELRFEMEMDTIHNMLTAYDQLIEEGNYMQGAISVGEAKTHLDRLETVLNEFPVMYQTCKHDLPLQLDELYKGLREMQKEGYHIEDLGLFTDINLYHSRLLDMVQELESGNTENANSLIHEIEEAIKDMYDQLEKEALARNYVETKIPTYEHAIKVFETEFIGTREEVERLKETYLFEETDLEQFIVLDKRFTQLKNQVAGFINRVRENEQKQSTLRVELEDAFTQLETLEREHGEFREGIHRLRKDELEARDQLERMNDDLFKTSRSIRNSNLPGVPKFIWSLIEDANSKAERVLSALEQQPLDIIKVQQSLSDAEEAVLRATEKTNLMLEQAYLTEHVIQYANRYRSSYPALAAKLIESESLFRKAEYEVALEEAANALEDVEPGALKKVEKFQELTVS